MKTAYAIGLLLMGIFTFVLMGIDKRRAVQNKWRIRERTLFLCAIFLGAVGGTAGMFLFHHKTRHLSFRLAFPALAVIQVILLFCL